jgi:hypothetical protein
MEKKEKNAKSTLIIKNLGTIKMENKHKYKKISCIETLQGGNEK